MPFDPKKLSKLKKIAKIAKEKEFGALDLILELEEKIDAIKDLAKGDPGEMGPKPVPGKDFPIPQDGDPGHTPTEAELRVIIEPLIPEPLPPLLPSHDELEAIIKPLIPAPIPGKPGKGAIPESPIQTRDKLASLRGKQRLDKSAVKGIDELEKDIYKHLSEFSGKIQFVGAGYAGVRSLSPGTPNVALSRNENGDVIINVQGDGTGSVTNFSFTNANGISGVVTNPTITPNLTLSLGAITPSSVAASGLVTGSNLSGTNSGDQTIVLSGDVSGTGTGAITTAIGANKVTLAQMAQIATGSFLGRNTASTGNVEVLSTATTKTMLGLSGSNSGDVSLAGENYITIAGQIITANAVNLSGSNATGTLAAGRFPALTGDLTTVTGALATTLATVNSNTGSFGSATQAGTFTVNGKGLITAASNVTITPAVGSITGLGTGVAAFLASPSSANLISAMTDETGSGALVFANSPTLITAVLGSSTATTQAPADNSTKVATTAYVDNAILGQRFKEAVKVATTANLVGVYLNGASGVGATFTYTATGVDVVDGINLALGDRILIKNQTSDFQNGIYTVTTAGALGIAGVLTRGSDFDQSSDIQTGDSVFVTSGNTQSTTTWAYTGIDNPTMGTTSIVWAQAAGQGSFTQGNGITITGVSIAIDTSVTVDKNTIQTLTNKTLTSPVFTAPVLGTPASGNLTNAIGLPVSTGISGLGSGVSTFLATPSSANLVSAVTDETGSGALVFGTTPTLATPVINGLATGTGVSGGATASTLAARDSNGNLTNNNELLGYATTATAAGATTLTVSSKYQQYFTGATTQTVTLPVASTLVLGQMYYIVNNSTGIVTVQSSGGNTVQAMVAGSEIWVTCILTSGTTAASWAVQYVPAAVSVATPSTLVLRDSSGNFALGTPTSGVLTNATGLPLTTGVTGVLPIANGGTNNSSTYTAGSAIYSDGAKLTQDNSNFFWDATNHRLGVGTTAPDGRITAVLSTGQISPLLTARWASPDTDMHLDFASVEFLNTDTTNNNYMLMDFSTKDTGGTTRHSIGRIGMIFTDHGTSTFNGDMLFVAGNNVQTRLYVQGTTGNIAIGSSAANSTLQVMGSFSSAYIAKTATYTATLSDYTIDCTANTFTVNLPTAVGITGRIYVIKNTGTGVITIDASGSEAIDGSLTKTLSTQYSSYMIQSNGVNWIIIN